jgi:hypothetical protein
MPKKYARFLPTSETFNLEDFPYFWISQVNAQYVQNIDNVLKKYGLDNSPSYFNCIECQTTCKRV